MNRLLNYVIFISLIGLIALADDRFWGISFSASEQSVRFDDIATTHKVIYTMPATKGISGYGGPVPMAMAVSDSGEILGIKVLKNSESPEFLNEVLKSNYLNNWIGKSVKDASTLDIDALSGATLSSSAISKSIKLKAQELVGGKLPSEKPINFLPDLYKLLGLLFVGVSGLGLFFFPAKLGKYRTALMVSSIAILGIWQGTMLSTGKITGWLLNGVPSLWGYGLFFIFLLSIIVPFITGRNFYCYHVCPFGASQDMVGKTIEIKTSINKYLFKGLEKIRIAVLLFCFILAMFGMASNIMMIEPFSAFKYAYAPHSAVVIFVASLLLSMFVKRPWCRYFCPCGAFLDLFKKRK